MIARLGRIFPMALAILAVAGAGSTALGQGNTFNPYGNSGYADYREFGLPMYSNDPSLPGQAQLNNMPLITKPRPNSFQQYTDSLDGIRDSGSVPSRSSSSGVPYFEAYRRYDQEYQRIYRPNAKVDQVFADRLKKREQLSRQARDEKDPVKRSAILRRLELESLDRRDPVAVAKPATRAPQAKAATPGGRTQAPNPFADPARRRTPAPSPFAPSRAPGAGRAPAPAPATSTPSAASTPSVARTPAPAARATPSTTPAPDPSTIAVPPPR